MNQAGPFSRPRPSEELGEWGAGPPSLGVSSFWGLAGGLVWFSFLRLHPRLLLASRESRPDP